MFLFGLQILSAFDVDREAVADADQCLADRVVSLSIAILSRMLSLRSWIFATSRPEGVLQQDRVAQPHSLAVNLVGAVSVLVLDPEVVADRDHLLAHVETASSWLVVSSSQQAHTSPSRAPVSILHAFEADIIQTVDSAQVGGSS